MIEDQQQPVVRIFYSPVFYHDNGSFVAISFHINPYWFKEEFDCDVPKVGSVLEMANCTLTDLEYDPWGVVMEGLVPIWFRLPFRFCSASGDIPSVRKLTVADHDLMAYCSIGRLSTTYLPIRA